MSAASALFMLAAVALAARLVPGGGQQWLVETQHTWVEGMDSQCFPTPNMLNGRLELNFNDLGPATDPFGTWHWDGKFPYWKYWPSCYKCSGGGPTTSEYWVWGPYGKKSCAYAEGTHETQQGEARRRLHEAALEKRAAMFRARRGVVDRRAKPSS